MFISSSSRIACQMVTPLGTFMPAAIAAPSESGSGYYERAVAGSLKDLVKVRQVAAG
jgi:hypothetical protein